MDKTFVKVWQEQVLIPTYGVGLPDKNPMFFENRVYQGSSGVVYPHPVIDKIYDEKEDKAYTGLFLENEYLKIMILPELGGRVQMAYDKIKQRHFVYYNQVIKPALVGLCGPWISGGIEFNWPQHHRPSTFQPVDFTVEENADGSKTIWVNEVERMFGTRGMAGFVLHPGKAYLEIRVQLFNRTPLPQTFLWWANPAVKVNDDYQSVFPPDVNAVFDHGKRDVSDFPIATGTYYKVNYAPGTDISRYKNIPVPTSYMAIRSEYDFLGGYEHDTRAGVLHVANHHVSPGKKQWTWGHSDFGQAWDRNLTDEDGPYIELMAGVFTDNQPDFSWLMPYEEKTFTQYFLPYRELGVVKNATKDLLLGLDDKELKVFATSEKKICVQVFVSDEMVLNEAVSVSPEQIFSRAISIGGKFVIAILDEQGKELLRYEPTTTTNDPEPAKPALLPAAIETNEELFLTGLHLEQYRHATCSPVPYYEEALRRDATDIRNNNALGLWYLRRGQFEKAERYFTQAVHSLTRKNPNPYDGEPYYNLGVCLKFRGKYKEAYDALYKGSWNSGWQHACFFSLAQIDLINNEYEKALHHLQLCLDRNAVNGKAYVLKMAVLRKLNISNTVGEEALRRDLFNLGVYFEQGNVEKLKELSGGEQNYIEYALDYAAAGLYDEALALLQLMDEPRSPMTFYYLGWLTHKRGNDCMAYFKKAAAADSAYCFPNRLIDVEVLTLATDLNKQDARAPYYLGNLWYDKRQYDEAIANWELAAQRDDQFPTVFRNLGLAWFNKRKDADAALRAYERAFALNETDARVLMELDQLYKRLNKQPSERLEFLEQHLALVEHRDDLYLERAALYNFLGDHGTAYELIMQRRFHPWEGGEGKVSGQYYYSLVEMAKRALQEGNGQKALSLLEQAQKYPENLGEGKLFGTRENDVFYWMGCASGAPQYFEKATEGTLTFGAAIVYNDQQPDKIFYQGLAWGQLGNKARAEAIFAQLVEYGTSHLNDEVRIDYFAVSLPDLLIFEDDLQKRNRVHCHYMRGLGLLGLQQFEAAQEAFNRALQEDAMHVGSKTHLQLLTQMATKELNTIG